MSALLTHAAAGVLIGLALGLRRRDLPLAAIITCVPDLDHLPIPGLVARGTLTNVFVCLLLPALVAVVAYKRGVRGPWLRVAAAAPVLLVAHLFLDMLPLDPLGDAEGVRLLYPFDSSRYFVDVWSVNGLDPLAVSAFTLAFGTLAALILGVSLWVRRAESPRPRAWGAPVAFALGFVALAPAAALSGLVVAEPAHPDASLALEDARVELPQGRFVAVVAHAGGRTAGAGALELDVLVDGAVSARATNPHALAFGDRWVVDVPVDARGHSRFAARLLATKDAHDYLDQRAGLVKSHVDSTLRLVRTPTGVALQDDGPFDVPAGAVRATATGLDGAPRMDAANPAPIPAGGLWLLPADALAVRFSVVGVDDGHAYVSDATA